MVAVQKKRKKLIFLLINYASHRMLINNKEKFLIFVSFIHHCLKMTVKAKNNFFNCQLIRAKLFLQHFVHYVYRTLL